MFKRIQYLIHSHSALTLIQNVRTQWNSIYNMMQRIYQLHNDICVWISQECNRITKSSKKLETLYVSEQKWQQVTYIMMLLQFFKKYTESMSQTHNSIMHKTFLVYINLFDHLKNQNNIKRLNSILKWTVKLKTAIEKALTKMKKYYVQIENESNLLYNIIIILDSTQKLSLYQVHFLLIFLTCISNVHH